MKHPIDTLSPQVMPEPNSGCWLWVGAVDSTDGYGKIFRRPRMLRAHRVSWEQHFGSIPVGKQVLHRCDVVCCVNPAHLFLGSNLDNIADRDAKGRASKGIRHYTRERRGERHHQAKLTDADVAAIRADTRPSKVIADDYPVSWRWIEKLRTRNGTRR